MLLWHCPGRLILKALRKILNKTKKLILTSNSDTAWKVPNPRDSDIYLISYPKSGNTWMRYLIAYATWPELVDIDLVEMASYVPSFQIEHDTAMMLDPASPCNHIKHRIIKEHNTYDKETQQNVKRVIYLVRDGRDAIVSYWHFCNQRDQAVIPLSKFIEISAKPEHSFGSWKDHVMGWVNAPLDARLIIRYEDMLDNAELWLRAALDFAEIEASDSIIKQAVNRASFDSMKKLEQTKGFNLDQLKTVEFIRQGKQGSWQDTFGVNDLELFRRFHGGCISELGYS